MPVTIITRVDDELTRVFGRKVDLGIFSSISPYMVEDVKREMLSMKRDRFISCISWIPYQTLKSSLQV